MTKQRHDPGSLADIKARTGQASHHVEPYPAESRYANKPEKSSRAGKSFADTHDDAVNKQAHGKSQSISSGEFLAGKTAQPKRTHNRPVKDNPEYRVAKKRNGGDIYS